MAHGGTRTGAGRKARPSKATRETRNTEFDEQASAALPELFTTIQAIAMGHKIGVYEKPRKYRADPMTDSDGTVIWVYDVPPDKAAAMYLIDRAAGKASVKSAEQTDTELTLEVNMSPLEDPDERATEPDPTGPDDD